MWCLTFHFIPDENFLQAEELLNIFVSSTPEIKKTFKSCCGAFLAANFSLTREDHSSGSGSGISGGAIAGIVIVVLLLSAGGVVGALLYFKIMWVNCKILPFCNNCSHTDRWIIEAWIIIVVKISGWNIWKF